MAKITDVYKQYKITAALQLHQLRVAAVAKQICDSLTIPVDTDSVIKACLLHDMGNLLKFDFSAPAELFEPEGVEYWKKVRAEQAQKYQTEDEHRATIIIAKELGVSQKVLKSIDSVGFNSSVKNAQSSDLEAKICDYADTRVSPQGVVSLKGRMDDGAKRYKDRPDYWMPAGQMDAVIEACYEIERQVLKNSKIKGADITNSSVAPIIEQLKSYEI